MKTDSPVGLRVQYLEQSGRYVWVIVAQSGHHEVEIARSRETFDIQAHAMRAGAQVIDHNRLWAQPFRSAPV